MLTGMLVHLFHFWLVWGRNGVYCACCVLPKRPINYFKIDQQSRTYCSNTYTVSMVPPASLCAIPLSTVCTGGTISAEPALSTVQQSQTALLVWRLLQF